MHSEDPYTFTKLIDQAAAPAAEETVDAVKTADKTKSKGKRKGEGMAPFTLLFFFQRHSH